MYFIVLSFKKRCEPKKKFKMAAKNPRWPPRKPVFWHFDPLLLRNGDYSNNRKTSSTLSKHGKKVSTKSDHFWGSYGPCKKACKRSKTCFLYKRARNINISILLKEQILCRRGWYTCIWSGIKFGWLVTELSPFNDFDYASLCVVSSTLLGIESLFLNRIWSFCSQNGHLASLYSNTMALSLFGSHIAK